MVVLEERRGGRPVVLEARRVGVEHDELVAYCIIRDFVLRPRAGGVAVGTRIADVGETVGGRSCVRSRVEAASEAILVDARGAARSIKRVARDVATRVHPPVVL